jgi:diguanylate cyclase (GGDEF)-like protein
MRLSNFAGVTTAYEFVAGSGGIARVPPDQTVSVNAEICHARAASLREWGALSRRNDALRTENAVLRQEVISLAQAVEDARRLGYYDELTGLPNRNLLFDRFKQAVAQAARRQEQVALLFLDLDRFKSINDVLGHAAGDSLLRQVAARLGACLRTSDTACRHGGDEFVVLLPEHEGRQGVVAATQKIRAHLGAPYVIGGSVVKMTASLGVALYPRDGKSCDRLLQVADRAMYGHKTRSLASPRIRMADQLEGAA